MCRQMRAERVMSPVLMLTARGSVEDRVTGLNVGADDYLTKPFTQAELLSAIQSCLTKYDRVAQRYQAQAQATQSIEKQLQLSQELADLNSALLQKLSQGLRHPVSNITIATYLLKQNLSDEDFDRYIAIVEEECARSTSLLNEVSGLQEYLHPAKLNLLRGKLKVRIPL
ncbi:MAG TPA: response regulator [Leptolyngbya sp.]|nr:response regulator [Leptolyngbya sp.]